MDAASALINGLSGEKIRWTEQSAQFQAETERLVGDVLLLVGFLSYAGCFNQEFRSGLVNYLSDSLTRRKIPVTMNMNLIDCLTDTATVLLNNTYSLCSNSIQIINFSIIVIFVKHRPIYKKVTF